ncbi:MAG: hypothetical protein EZS28_015647 [Streblomastix strix]|uniref:Uncharacterized protein n=1 Tax=Streblomastix strix TaxID=222440 RepID=A0A5J4W1Q9_9EUKA|nr:MAG: hypothetical protein EZS28_015647 [Streblomastix strix]
MPPESIASSVNPSPTHSPSFLTPIVLTCRILHHIIRHNVLSVQFAFDHHVVEAMIMLLSGAETGIRTSPSSILYINMSMFSIIITVTNINEKIEKFCKNVVYYDEKGYNTARRKRDVSTAVNALAGLACLAGNQKNHSDILKYEAINIVQHAVLEPADNIMQTGSCPFQVYLSPGPSFHQTFEFSFPLNEGYSYDCLQEYNYDLTLSEDLTVAEQPEFELELDELLYL